MDQGSWQFGIPRPADLKKGLKSNGGYRPCFLRTLPKHGRSSGKRPLAPNFIELSSNKICAVWRHKFVSQGPSRSKTRSSRSVSRKNARAIFVFVSLVSTSSERIESTLTSLASCCLLVALSNSIGRGNLRKILSLSVLGSIFA